MIDTCIFDFDGTLADSMQDVFDSLTFAFRECGFPAVMLSPAAIMQHQLPDAVGVAVPGITPDNRERVIRCFISHYDAAGFPNTKPFPGVADTLEELKQRGIPCFIVSNKRMLPIVTVLQNHRLSGYFKDILTPDQFTDRKYTKPEIIDFCVKKHALDKAATAYIGDMELDVVAARQSGVIAIVVESGYGKAADFSVQADYVIQGIPEVLGIVGKDTVKEHK